MGFQCKQNTDSLLSVNLNKIVQEDKTKSNPSYVRTALHNEHRHLAFYDYIGRVVMKPHGGVGSGKKHSYDHSGEGEHSEIKKAIIGRWAEDGLTLSHPGPIILLASISDGSRTHGEEIVLMSGIVMTGLKSSSLSSSMSTSCPDHHGRNKYNSTTRSP